MMMSPGILDNCHQGIEPSHHLSRSDSYMPCDSSPVIDSLIKNIDQLSNDSVRLQVTLFCSTLNQYIRDLHIDSAPMFVDMDGEDVYFEWIFKDFRFGFFFFANNEDHIEL